MRHLTLLILCFFFISCNNFKTEYYANGNISKRYSLVNGKYNGTFEEFFENGNYKEIHIYNNGIKTDSSIYFNANNKIYLVDYYLPNDTIESIFYYSDMVVKEKGKYIKNNKIGKWKYFRRDGTLDKVFEYINLKGEQYTNQGWYFDTNGDTLKEFGNFYTIKLSSNVTKINNPILLDFTYKPLLAINPDVIICFSTKLEHDFSNLNKVKLDTIFLQNTSLENFKLIFKSRGKRNLRGFVKESYDRKPTPDDTIAHGERVLYFDVPIIVN